MPLDNKEMTPLQLEAANEWGVYVGSTFHHGDHAPTVKAAQNAFLNGYIRAAESKQAEIDRLKGMVQDSRDFLLDLKVEWVTIFGTTDRNQGRYNNLKELIARIDNYLNQQ